MFTKLAVFVRKKNSYLHIVFFMSPKTISDSYEFTVMSGNHLQSDTASTQKQGKYLTPFQRQLLQKSLQDNLPQQYRLRIEIMLLADQGKTQTQIFQTLGCSPGTARQWICIARSGQAHNWNHSPIGKPKTVNDEYLERLKQVVSHDPREFGYPFQRWTSQWLSKHLANELGVEVGDRHIRRLLQDMGLSTRPKSSSPKEATQTDTSSIVIGDLSSAKAPNSFIIDPFKKLQTMETVINCHQIVTKLNYSNPQ